MNIAKVVEYVGRQYLQKSPNFVKTLKAALRVLSGEYGRLYDTRSYLAAIRESIFAGIFDRNLEECLVRSEARGEQVDFHSNHTIRLNWLESALGFLGRMPTAVHNFRPNLIAEMLAERHETETAQASKLLPKQKTKVKGKAANRPRATAKKPPATEPKAVPEIPVLCLLNQKNCWLEAVPDRKMYRERFPDGANISCRKAKISCYRFGR